MHGSHRSRPGFLTLYSCIPQAIGRKSLATLLLDSETCAAEQVSVSSPFPPPVLSLPVMYLGT